MEKVGQTLGGSDPHAAIVVSEEGIVVAVVHRQPVGLVEMAPRLAIVAVHSHVGAYPKPAPPIEAQKIGLRRPHAVLGTEMAGAQAIAVKLQAADPDRVAVSHPHRLVRGFGQIDDVIVQQSVGALEVPPASILQAAESGRSAHPYPSAAVHQDRQNYLCAFAGDLDALEPPPASAPASQVQARARTGPDPPLGIGGQTIYPLIQQPGFGAIKLGLPGPRVHVEYPARRLSGPPRSIPPRNQRQGLADPEQRVFPRLPLGALREITTEAGLRGRPDGAAVFPPHRPDYAVAQSLRFGPCFSALVAEPAHQSAAIQSNPRRPFAVLQKEVHRCAGQPVGLANQRPTTGCSSCQPLRGGHIDLAIPIHQHRRVARRERQPRVAPHEFSGAFGKRDQAGITSHPEAALPVKQEASPAFPRHVKPRQNPAALSLQQTDACPAAVPHAPRGLDGNSVDLLRAVALAGNRMQAKLALPPRAGRRRHQQTQAGSDVEIAAPIRSDGVRAIARPGPDRRKRLPLEPRQPLGGTGPDLPIRRLVQRLNLHRGQALRLRIGAELPAIVAEQAILRAHPEESGTVLHQAVNVQVGQTRVLSVLLEAVALPRQDARQEQDEDRAAEEWTHHYGAYRPFCGKALEPEAKTKATSPQNNQPRCLPKSLEGGNQGDHGEYWKGKRSI